MEKGALTEMVSGLYYSHTSSIDTIDGVMGSSHDNIREGSQYKKGASNSAPNNINQEGISEKNAAVNNLIKGQVKQKSNLSLMILVG